jgi:cell wall assembly regulator SMI1
MSENLIARLDRWLASHRPRYYASLLPGAERTAVEAFESQVGLSLPPTYRALLEWRNGQRPNCFEALQFNWGFLSLESVAGAKHTLDDMLGSDFEDPKWWRAGWVPFLDNGGGDLLCMDMTAEDGGVPGQLSQFWHDEEDRSIEYPSIDRWLQVFVESLEAGIWREEDDMLQPRDDAAWAAFLREHNPGYPVRRKAG